MIYVGNISIFKKNIGSLPLYSLVLIIYYNSIRKYLPKKLAIVLGKNKKDENNQNYLKYS